MNHNTSNSIVEALESRIVPAAVFTFTDVDGDAVTVKTSKGTNADLSAATDAAKALSIITADVTIREVA
jgi:hypothetical protein